MVREGAGSQAAALRAFVHWLAGVGSAIQEANGKHRDGWKFAMAEFEAERLGGLCVGDLGQLVRLGDSSIDLCLLFG